MNLTNNFEKLYKSGSKKILLQEGDDISKNLSICLQATNYCPNECYFCCHESNLKGEHLNLEKVKYFMNDVINNGVKISYISLTGGEPVFNNDLISFLEWAKSDEERLFKKKYDVLLVTAGVNPNPRFAKTYNERMTYLIENELLNKIRISDSAGVKPKERVENLIELLKNTKNVGSINKIIKIELSEDKKEDYFSSRIFKKIGENKFNVFSPSRCNVVYNMSNPIKLFSDIKISEKGDVFPCLKVEAAISCIPSLGNIEHGYDKLKKRSIVYTYLLKEFFNQYEKEYYNPNCCGFCAEGFNQFLEKKAENTD